MIIIKETLWLLDLRQNSKFTNLWKPILHNHRQYIAHSNESTL
jgi:hypothetical protein